MKKIISKKRAIVAGVLVALNVGAVGGTVLAEEIEKTYQSFTPKSYGSFIYDDGDSENNNGKEHDLVLDSSDITNLNDNLNVLKSTSDTHTSDITTLKTDVASCFQSVSEGKALLASTLTDLGVETAKDATFDTINTNIKTLADNKYQTGYEEGVTNAKVSVTTKTYTSNLVYGAPNTVNIGSGHELVYFKATSVSMSDTADKDYSIDSSYNKSSGSFYARCYADTENVTKITGTIIMIDY